MNRAAGDSHTEFTPRQGQYLAFIHTYTLVNGRPPAQTEMQRFFQVTPPSVHQMLLTLERGDGFHGGPAHLECAMIKTSHAPPTKR
jgi:hypothetical protein